MATGLWLTRSVPQPNSSARQGKEFTHRFPELAKAVARLGAESVILDTELAVFDRQLISRFEWLRAHPKEDVATPPMLVAFDLLELDGEDQRKRPLRGRRQALEHLLKGERLILPVRSAEPQGLGRVEGSAAGGL